MNTRLIVQSLHDVRAKILFAFLFAGHAMTLKELMTWTGSPRQNHYVHLNALCGGGMLAIQKKASGEHVYLLGSEMLPALQSWVAQLDGGKLELEDGPSLLERPLQQAFPMSGNQPPAVIAEIQYDSYDASFDKNMAACRKVGIGFPTSERLSKMHHVTPGLIIDHVESLCPGETIGLAINRIAGNEMPRKWLEQIALIQKPEEDVIEAEEETE
jgi:hypothetical protein